MDSIELKELFQMIGEREVRCFQLEKALDQVTRTSNVRFEALASKLKELGVGIAFNGGNVEFPPIEKENG